jgi:hypothetical protein
MNFSRVLLPTVLLISFLCRKGEILLLQCESALALKCWNEAFEIYEKPKSNKNGKSPEEKAWDYITESVVDKRLQLIARMQDVQKAYDQVENRLKRQIQF